MAQGALAGRLEAFLAPRGLTREMIVAAVEGLYGHPLLIVATGSILHGFGNQRSDVDINVVLDKKVAQLPVPLFPPGARLDTVCFGTSEVENWVSILRDQPWPPPGHVDRKQWRQRRAEFFNCTRFAYGLVLSARDGWDSHIAAFHEPWLAERVVRWWWIEAHRRGIAGRWLADAKPLLAAQRYLEAVLAALESRVAAAGQPYFGTKWLSEKLRTLDDSEGLAILREVGRAPATDREAQSYIARCDTLLAALGVSHADSLAAQLWYLPSVTARKLDTGTLVSRWNMRGLELSGAVPAVPQPPAPIWEGGLDVPPSANLAALFIADMTWLSIVTRTA